MEEKDRRLFETSSAPNPVPDTEPSKSWIETAINSFLGSYLAKLVRGCTICAER